MVFGERRRLAAILFASVAAAPEPAARALTEVPLRITTPLGHVSAARELSDGRVLITNAKQPAVLLLDPLKGTTIAVGAAGGGPDRYARPGGLYAGEKGTTLLIDRGQTRAFTISPTGTLLGSRSIARRGLTSSSDGDIDLQQVDAAGFVYFRDRSGLDESSVMRLEPDSQKLETVARLRLPERRTIPAGDGAVLMRSFIGSPADGWGVAPSGRVAIVRAQPYRIEWAERDGRLTSGPVIEYTPLPMTDADKRHYAATRGATVAVGLARGSKPDATGSGMLFAPTKAPFAPDEVLVSPSEHAWVMRTQPLDVVEVLYDVFDRKGVRVDRVTLPAASRIVGFGAGAVYVRRLEGETVRLRKYRWK